MSAAYLSPRSIPDVSWLAPSRPHRALCEWDLWPLGCGEEPKRVVEWFCRADGPIPYLGLPASGMKFKIRAAAVGEIDRGKIKRHREYWDAGAFLAQLDIPRPPMVDYALGAMTEGESERT